MTHYDFFFKCGKCGAISSVRYRVPNQDRVWVTLSCKNCESPMLKVYNDNYSSGNRYKVWDIVRERYILGDSNNTVPRDVFWAWVTDHGGDRYDE